MTSWKMNIRHETCIVIFFITIMGIFPLQCPTNKACHCLLKYDRLAAKISCYINNSGFRIYIEQHVLIQIDCINSPEWSNLKDFDLNMTPLMSYQNIIFDNCNLPSNNSLSDIAYTLGATSIEQLHFSSYNKFNLTLKKYHLNGFKNLKTLHLMGNNLVYVDKDLLADLRNLTGLQLFKNNLHHLPVEFFDYATQLKYIVLRSNKLKLVAPGTFDKLNDLQFLDLSNNHLTELRIENKNLLGLNISNNKNLTLLQHGSFSNMIKLIILSMKNNGLITLPEDLLWRSIQLQFIDLSHNYLKSLPKHVFRDVINLKVLLLNSNNIEELSDYIFENTSFLKKLDLSNNRITFISGKLFNGLYKLEELNMEQNHLRTISIESFSSLKSLKIAKFSNNHLTLQSTFFYPNVAPILPFHNCSLLEELYLSYNNISEIILDGLSRTIRILELHSNNISKIRPDVLEFFSYSTTLTYLTLHDNPWECNCDTVNFLHFIHTEYRKITNISQIMCLGINKSVLDMIVYDFCPLDTTAIISISVLIALIGFIICILKLYYKYQEHIKIWLFAHERCLRFVTEEQLDQEKLYDAFVSYSHKDHNFVINELIPKLEDGPRPYKLCLHYRECLIDECILDIITRSVQNSKRTIVILSPNFLDNVWGKMEFRIAHCQALSEDRARVIFIFYDDVGLLDDLDSELKAIISLSMNTCIQWGDSWFWDKLKYALPHQSTRLKSSIIESEVIENGEL